MSDEVWAWTLRIGVPLISAALLFLIGWWVKNQSDKTLLQKVLSQLAAVLQGLASDVTSGIGPALEQALSDGKVTAEERKALIERLVLLVKNSASGRLITQTQKLLGLQPGSAFESWLRGMAGEHIDAQLATALPGLPSPASVARLAGSFAPTPVIGMPAARIDPIGPPSRP